MQNLIPWLFVVVLTACASGTKSDEMNGVTIVEVKPNQWTALAKNHMFDLLSQYKLQPFLFTKTIHLESRVIPHSHPVLTLNTRHAKEPNKLLATWLHEEFHWWLDQNADQTDKAIEEFRKLYPTLPTQGIAQNEHSTYLHLAVCFLEFKAITKFLGKDTAKAIIKDHVTKDKIYPWIYVQVLNQELEIASILHQHKLIPPGLR